MSHTPGPWEWDWGFTDNLYNAAYLAEERKRREMWRAGQTPLMDEYPPHSDAIVQTDGRVYGPNDDDARLIAEAPNMLAALKQAEAALRAEAWYADKAIDILSTAIARVEEAGK